MVDFWSKLTDCLLIASSITLRCGTLRYCRCAICGRLLVVATGNQHIRLPTNHGFRCRRVGGVPGHLAEVREPGSLPGNQRRGIISPVGALHTAALPQRARLRPDYWPGRVGARVADFQPSLLRPRRMHADQRRVSAGTRRRLFPVETAERARLFEGDRRRGVSVGEAVQSTATAERLGLFGGRSGSTTHRSTMLSPVCYRTQQRRILLVMQRNFQPSMVLAFCQPSNVSER